LGIGWSLEEAPTATGVSADGASFEAAMRRAIASMPLGRTVDCVVAHAPGSVKGDQAELSAISRVFGGVMTVSTKHLTGHTYGASGMVSLAVAQSLLYGATWAGFPYKCLFSSELPGQPGAVLINTAGFGGNCISIVVGRP
jgi:3-oxoacyl-(acyl-carrier-protein) synthase